MKLHRPFFVLLLSAALLMCALFGTGRVEAAGELDPTFSGDGKIRFSFGAGGGNGARDVAVDSSGRVLVVGGPPFGGDSSFAVARYLPDGSLDQSFGDSGVVITNLAVRDPNIALSGQEEARAIAIQPDGKILVAGNVQSTTNADFALVRYNPDGLLDSSFGSSGVATFDFNGNDFGTDVAIQSDNKIVVAGSSAGNFAVVRFNPDGKTVDSAFNGTGYKVMTGIMGDPTSSAALKLQSDGKILVAGSPDVSSTGAFYIVRLMPDGSYDTTFGSGGLAARGSAAGGGGHCTSITIQPGTEFLGNPDRIVVAGYTFNGNRELVVVMRFNLNGTPDTSFDGDGEVATDLTGVANGGARAQAVVVDNGQNNIRKILIAASVSRPSGGATINEAAVLRYLSSGSLDATFDNDGVAVFDANATSFPATLTLGAAGKILFSGGTGGRFVTTRLNSNGALDTSFDVDGTRTDQIGGAESFANGVAVQPDGKIVVVGSGGGVIFGIDRAVARLNVDGTLDLSFDADGKAIGTDGTDGAATAVTLQPDGKILVAGARSVGANNTDAAVARYNTNGSLDANFAGGVATSGFAAANDFANAIARQSDGRIVVGGYAQFGSGRDIEVVRFNPDGSPDNTFDFDGKVNTSLGTADDEVRGVAIQRDGKIVAAGYATNGKRQFFVARFTPTGVFDQSFDQDGVTFTSIGPGDSGANAVAIDRFGRIVAAGFSSNGTNDDVTVVRYLTDGSLDSSFGTGGMVVTPVGNRDDIGTGIAIQPDGKIVVTGSDNISTTQFGVERYFILVRYLEDGTLDASYASGGKIVLPFNPSGRARENANAIALDANANAIVAGEADQLFGVARVLAGPLATFSTLANISTRLLVQTDDNALIGGFIVTGTQPKKVIVRAIGPSLPFADKLQNPVLELHGPNGLIEMNDDWVNSPNKQAIIDTTIPPPNDLESAIVQTLPANNAGYTAIVRGVNNGVGIGLVEAFDLDQSVDSKLANISTRGLVLTDDKVLIAGTILLGETMQKVIVRAIGPSLPFAGTLQNPTLELRDQNGGLVDANDDWVNSPNKQAIIDSTIAPSNDLESAIVQILPSNRASYTAIVRGVNDTKGIAVVEVFALN